MFDLTGMTALVTGASGGIGSAIAEALARRGARVTLMARTTDALDTLAAALRERHGAEAAAVACDVTSEASVRDAFHAARQAHGDPQILVNNAGAAEAARFTETDRDVWNRMLAVNVGSVYACTREALPAMLAARQGRIVNVASTAGLRGYKRMTAYCAAKHAVVGLTRALALEVAKVGVTVNAVCPGYTETDMTEQAVANLVEGLGVTADHARAMLVRVVPRGTLASPAEVASAVAWLCAPESAAVTGIALPVAGGEVS